MNEKQTGSAIVILLVFNIFTLGSFALFAINSMNTQENLKTSIRALKEPQMIVFLKVEYEEITYSYSLELTKRPIFMLNNDSTVNGWDFSYRNTDLVINSTFRYIYLEISMKTEDYSLYNLINCEWTVEDKTGVIRKADFQDSEIYHGYYTGIEELGRNFWKEVIPNEIKLEVDLKL